MQRSFQLTGCGLRPRLCSSGQRGSAQQRGSVHTPAFVGLQTRTPRLQEGKPPRLGRSDPPAAPPGGTPRPGPAPGAVREPGRPRSTAPGPAAPPGSAEPGTRACRPAGPRGASPDAGREMPGDSGARREAAARCCCCCRRDGAGARARRPAASGRAATSRPGPARGGGSPAPAERSLLVAGLLHHVRVVLLPQAAHGGARLPARCRRQPQPGPFRAPRRLPAARPGPSRPATATACSRLGRRGPRSAPRPARLPGQEARPGPAHPPPPRRVPGAPPGGALPLSLGSRKSSGHFLSVFLQRHRARG